MSLTQKQLIEVDVALKIRILDVTGTKLLTREARAGAWQKKSEKLCIIVTKF